MSLDSAPGAWDNNLSKTRFHWKQHSTPNIQRRIACTNIMVKGWGRRPCASLGVGVLAARELPPPRRCAGLHKYYRA